MPTLHRIASQFRPSIIADNDMAERPLERYPTIGEYGDRAVEVVATCAIPQREQRTRPKDQSSTRG